MMHHQRDKVSNTGLATHDFGQIQQVLHWANQHENFAYFNPNGHNGLYGAFAHFLATGNNTVLKSDRHSLNKLDSFLHHHPFAIGFLSYDLKNEIHPLQSPGKHTIEAPNISFFRPEKIISFDNTLKAYNNVPGLNEIARAFESRTPYQEHHKSQCYLTCHTTKQTYIDNANRIKQDIIDGNYYEINYCIEFSAENVDIDPIGTYLKLNRLSPMPFSVLYKHADTYIICASPERFLKKDGDKLISQPIKGTTKRGRSEPEDETLKSLLFHSEKERAENMMIVDLVRNDLSKSAIPGSVKVDELFGISSFKQIHQMVSTVSSTLLPGIHFTDIIRNTFPMGSMTGAPKLRVMQTIDEIEPKRRGIYSGTIGYITPDGNFDFNVVIRSIVYNQKTKRLSFHVGSAITYDADPEKEYEECMLKARSMVEVLQMRVTGDER